MFNKKQLVKCSVCKKYSDLDSFCETFLIGLCGNCNRMPLKQVMNLIRKYEGTT